MSKVSNRALDIATRVTAVAIVVAAGFLGYQVWAASRSVDATSPASRAIQNLRTAVTNSPGDAALRVQLGDALLYSGDQDGALEQYSAAIEIDPKSAQALSGLATIAMGRRELKTAESYWKKIIDLLDEEEMASQDLRLEQAYHGLGVVYIDMKRYEDAAVNLKEATRIKDSNSDTHYMLSIAYRELGFPDKQRDELVITLAFDPLNAQANYDIGMLALKEGNPATAAEYFRIAADNAPESIELPAEELRKLEREADAKTRLNKAISLKETDTATALTEARIASALDPEDSVALRLVAELWEEKGETGEALAAYRRLAKLLPQDAVAAEAIKRLSADGNR